MNRGIALVCGLTAMLIALLVVAYMASAVTPAEFIKMSCEHWGEANPYDLPEGYQYELQFEDGASSNLFDVRCCHRASNTVEWECSEESLTIELIPEVGVGLGFVCGIVFLVAIGRRRYVPKIR